MHFFPTGHITYFILHHTGIEIQGNGSTGGYRHGGKT